MRVVLITGATGFVARALFARRLDGYSYIACSRQRIDVEGAEWRASPSLGGEADWRPALHGVDSVVHLASRVHLPPDADPAAYQAENHEESSMDKRRGQHAPINYSAHTRGNRNYKRNAKSE